MERKARLHITVDDDNVLFYLITKNVGHEDMIKSIKSVINVASLSLITYEEDVGDAG